MAFKAVFKSASHFEEILTVLKKVVGDKGVSELTFSTEDGLNCACPSANQTSMVQVIAGAGVFASLEHTDNDEGDSGEAVSVFVNPKLLKNFMASLSGFGQIRVTHNKWNDPDNLMLEGYSDSPLKHVEMKFHLSENPNHGTSFTGRKVVVATKLTMPSERAVRIIADLINIKAQSFIMRLSKSDPTLRTVVLASGDTEDKDCTTKHVLAPSAKNGISVVTSKVNESEFYYPVSCLAEARFSIERCEKVSFITEMPSPEGISYFTVYCPLVSGVTVCHILCPLIE